MNKIIKYLNGQLVERLLRYRLSHRALKLVKNYVLFLEKKSAKNTFSKTNVK